MKHLAPKLTLISFFLICVAAIAINLQSVQSKTAAVGAPEISKIEPPNWWANHSIGSESNSLRLLIRGAGLSGARFVKSQPGITVKNVKVNAAGTYIFADLIIGKTARPGKYPLQFTIADGPVEAPFEISPPLPRAGNFQGFTQDDVMYLIMPDRFANGDASNDDPAVSRGLFDRGKSRRYHGGDFQGVINKLPYLKDLGVTAIWLNPIYDNNNQLDQKEVFDGEATTGYHGYGAVDFYAVEEHFGDIKKFRELVEAAHKLGIKIIQDQVANHTGPYHPWVKDAPTPTWFNGTAENHINENWQTHLLIDRYATAEMLKPVLDGWFVNILPDLNQNDPEAAKYVIQNTLWWIGMTGLDAVRQDTLPYVPRKFWREWMTAIKREYPNVNVVGETLDGLPAQVAFFQGGVTRWDGIDSKVDTEFDYPLHFPIRRVFGEGQSVRQLVDILNQDYLYPAPDKLVTLLGSHDVQRFMNERGATIDGLKLAFTFLLTVRGTPQLYYGDEIALPGGNDPDNRRDFPGGWPNDSRNAFEPANRTAEEQSVFDHLRKAAKLRAELEPLRRGKTAHLAINDQSYAFARFIGGKTVIVALNNSTQPEPMDFVVPRILNLRDGTVLRNRLGSGAEVKIEGGKMKFTLAPRASVILE